MTRAVQLSLLGIFATLVLHAAPALANGRFPAANQIVFAPNDPSRILVRVTFGVLVSNDNGVSWSWICETPLSALMQEDPAFAVMGDNSVLESVFAGQRRASADLCSWNFVDPDLTMVDIADNVLDPTNADRAYIVTSQGDQANGLWRTDDDGQIWTAVGPRFSNMLLETVEVAKANPMRVYMTGAIPPTSTMHRQPYIFTSDDGGRTWQMYPLTLERDATQTDINAYLAAVDPHNADRIFVRISGSPNDHLWVSDNGGMTSHEVASFPQMLGFAQSEDGQKVWIGSPLGGLYMSTDRGEHFTQISTMAISCLGVRHDELWACGDEFNDHFSAAKSLDDGMSFTSMIHFRNVVTVPSCPSDSLVTTSCAPMLADLANLFGPPDVVDGGVVADAAMDASADAATRPMDGAVIAPLPYAKVCGCAVAKRAPTSNADAAATLACAALASATWSARKRSRKSRRAAWSVQS